MNSGNTDILPFDEWFEQNKYAFPAHLTESAYDNIDFLYFLQHVYRQFMDSLTPKLYNLMLNHYPVFSKETRPKVLKRIYVIVESISYDLIFKVYEIFQDQFVNLDVRDKYPEFEKWRESYTALRTPETIDDSIRDQYPYYTFEEWIKFRDSENKAFLQYFNWYESRFKEFTTLLNSTLKELYPQIKELRADEKVMVTIHITDEYEQFKSECEQVELFIDCNFPEEDINLNFTQFSDKYSLLSREIKDHADALRSRRISGEKI